VGGALHASTSYVCRAGGVAKYTCTRPFQFPRRYVLLHDTCPVKLFQAQGVDIEAVRRSQYASKGQRRTTRSITEAFLVFVLLASVYSYRVAPKERSVNKYFLRPGRIPLYGLPVATALSVMRRLVQDRDCRRSSHGKIKPLLNMRFSSAS
jgi:hypothetical protein